jgi:hypothetical protein
MDKKPGISIAGLITIVVSVASLAVSILIYNASRNSNRSVVSVQPYPPPENNAPPPNVPFIHVVACYDPAASAFVAKYKVSRNFVVTNNGGLNVSLISIHFYDQLRAGDVLTGLSVVPGIYRYAKATERLTLPIVFAGGTGEIFNLRYEDQFRFPTKQKLYQSWVWQKGREVHWEFEFSNGSRISLPEGSRSADITDQTGRNCN